MTTNDVFGAVYADQYDLLYADKDYEAECDFIEQVFQRFANRPICSILDLGCGTGGHAIPLAQRGYQVTGVDISAEMLAQAQRKATATFNVQRSSVPTFHQGDLRTIELGCTFDAVLMMFAVLSYQHSNDGLAAALTTVRRHLAPGGLFVCDFWYGPAVLTQRPSERVKVIEQGSERFIRLVHPTLDTLHHTVRVDYHLLQLRDRTLLAETQEQHLMRFLFPQELAYFASVAGLKVEHLCPFMALEQAPTEQDWNVAAVTRKELTKQ